ncbi:MAG: F0F1 ATP synthase subunit A [Anaeromyxobacteraceae bacterium]|nr:F0F1 ATP synthase subunit A [Anaeromyxobacteraceae bacterium]
MIASTLVTLALQALLASSEPQQATPPHAAVEQADGHAAPADAHGAPAGEHGDAAAHGGGHDESLGAVMMHHVADGYVIEYPGVCHGGFAWNCEWDLRATFGDAFKFGGLDMTPTKHVIMMWLASALLLLVVFSALRKKAMVPSGLYSFVEVLVKFVRDELAVANIGKKDADRFIPYLLTAFFFILFVNLFGLLPWSGTATANVNVTVCLALFTFFITQYAAISAMGIGGYLGHLTGGVPKSLWPLWFIMIPVEFLGLFTKPFALTVRLFANMVAGHFVILALLGLIFAISVWVFPVSVALALAIFMLELFVAFVQAYIFTMLSSLFIGAAFAHHGDDHSDDGHGDHGAGHEAHGHAGAHH